MANRPKPLYPTVCIDDSHQEFLLSKNHTYIVYGESPFMLLIETNQRTLEWFGRARFNPNGFTVGVKPESEV